MYRTNATLGVGKLDYLIASGIKQKNLQDNFDLEKFLKLDEITPMQTSYTQTAEDRLQGEVSDTNKTDDESNTTSKEEKTDIEPSAKETSSEAN